MAKKLVIQYNANIPSVPSVTFCKYDITLDGVSIIYGNGYTTSQFFYSSNPNTDFFKVEPGLTLNETIENTMLFFNSFWYNTDVNYQRVGDTIEILLSEFYDITFDDAFTNENITISIQDNPNYTNNLRYFILLMIGNRIFIKKAIKTKPKK